MTWNEQLKNESNSFAESLLDENKNIEVIRQKTSYIDHKCFSCKKTIPSGKPLIRETKKIYTQYSENPVYSNKYFCNDECYGNKDIPVKEKKVKEIEIPKGFEIVNG